MYFGNSTTVGLDKPDIRTVMNLDVPYSPEAYLQETDRAGRDGSPVQATLLYSQEDLGFTAVLGNPLPKSTGDTVARTSGVGDCPEAPVAAPLASERYARMLDYALDTSRCRREQLLGFLGQEPGSCGGCDVCDGRVLNRAEGEAQILEVVRRGLASYHGFGALAGWKEEEIEEALETLRRRGAIEVLKRGFWKNRITADKVGDDTSAIFPLTNVDFS
jgi:superfamily II DNA helicase RecQ